MKVKLLVAIALGMAASTAMADQAVETFANLVVGQYGQGNGDFAIDETGPGFTVTAGANCFINCENQGFSPNDGAYSESRVEIDNEGEIESGGSFFTYSSFGSMTGTSTVINGNGIIAGSSSSFGQLGGIVTGNGLAFVDVDLEGEAESGAYGAFPTTVGTFDPFDFQLPSGFFTQQHIGTPAP